MCPQESLSQVSVKEALKDIQNTLPADTENRQNGVLVTLHRIITLLCSEEYDEVFLPPSAYAGETVSSLVIGANSKMQENFPQGWVAADGDGGIRIEWQGEEREVRLVIPARRGGRMSLYHEAGSAYSTENDMTSDHLAHWLDWLVAKRRRGQ